MKFKIKELYNKYKEIINYLIFGVLTTAVNFIVYLVCAKLFHIDEVVSNVIAWFLSVLFAYVTNKIYVFESKSVEKNVLMKEIVSFFGCRLFSGIMDIILFSICVKAIHMNDMIAKIIISVLVVILNYIFSKLIIFKKKK